MAIPHRITRALEIMISDNVRTRRKNFDVKKMDHPLAIPQLSGEGMIARTARQTPV
jgi:hypothetical protein